jgi:holliday junction DNA helicase RuvA
LELRDRLGAPTGGRLAVRRPEAEPWRDQVRQALTSLGWSAKESDSAIEQVSADAAASSADTPDVAAMLRAALRTLSRA